MDINELKALESSCWHDLNIAYSATKKLFILSEEKLKNMMLFPAPLLEHRDALDHIMRYSTIIADTGLCEDAITELTNAKQHEIRAFFDVADYICISIRREISDTLDVLSKRQIKKIWPEYEIVRAEVIDLSDDLAIIRTNRRESISAIPDYEEAVDKMFKIYRHFQLKVLPGIGQGFLYRINKILNG